MLSDETGETLLFTNYSDTFVEYDPRDGLEKRGLQKRKPDRVFGLSRTKSLDCYSKVGSVKGLRHSPFPDADMLYPFLILEAKSEGRGPGFESIETQQRFPSGPASSSKRTSDDRAVVPWILLFGSCPMKGTNGGSRPV